MDEYLAQRDQADREQSAEIGMDAGQNHQALKRLHERDQTLSQAQIDLAAKAGRQGKHPEDRAERPGLRHAYQERRLGGRLQRAAGRACRTQAHRHA